MREGGVTLWGDVEHYSSSLKWLSLARPLPLSLVRRDLPEVRARRRGRRGRGVGEEACGGGRGGSSWPHRGGLANWGGGRLRCACGFFLKDLCFERGTQRKAERGHALV